MAVHEFKRVLEEWPPLTFDTDVIVTPVIGTTVLEGSFALSIDTATLLAGSVLAGSFALEISAGLLTATGVLSGTPAIGVSAGALIATGVLSGSFEISISAGALVAIGSIPITTVFQGSLFPPSEDIKDILESDSSLALIFGTDLFIGPAPNKPNTLISVLDSPGEPSETGYTYERPHVQVFVRSGPDNYRSGHVQAQAIADVLHGMNEQMVNGSRYLGIWLVGDVNVLGEDRLSRSMFTVNFRLHRTRQ